MKFNTAYEVLDYLSKKNNMFAMVKTEMENKDANISDLQSKIDLMQSALDDMLLGGGL